MTQLRVRFTWYFGVAFSASLLLAAPHGRAAAAHTIAQRDSHAETQSTKPAPALRLQPSADAPRQIERGYFQAAEPLQLEQFQAIAEPARTSQSQPAGATLRQPLARSPPAHR